MEWPVILVLVLAAPIILLPVAFVWYLNIAGIVGAYKESREKEPAADKKQSKKVAEGDHAKGRVSG